MLVAGDEQGGPVKAPEIDGLPWLAEAGGV